MARLLSLTVRAVDVWALPLDMTLSETLEAVSVVVLPLDELGFWTLWKRDK